MTRRVWSCVRQHETHRELLRRPRPSTRRTSGLVPDAIIVPASRPAENLKQVVSLTREVGCTLVVLCSLEARSADVTRLLKASGIADAAVVDIPPSYRHPLLEFETSGLARQMLPRGCANPNGDLSMKRNLGLLAARMAGWERIVFIDDDIRGIGSADLTATVAMLNRCGVAGMRVEKFPDNSVVCHARREIGDEQDVFVTGSVLAVNCARPVGFFPEIYNEDWLFFYDDVRAGQVEWSKRYARQLKYDPFANPRRARQQEFGDVLAEGLYALLHKKAGHEETTWAYWDGFIAARRKLIEEIKKRARSLEPPLRGKVVSALEGAIASLVEIQPWACEMYVSTWRYDLEVWKKRLVGLPSVGSLEASLGELGLKQDANWKTAPVPTPVEAMSPLDCREPALKPPAMPALWSLTAAVGLMCVATVVRPCMRLGSVLLRKG